MEGEDAVEWKQVMQEEYEEYESLITNDTWELPSIPKGSNSIGCKWVFHAKRDVCSDIVRYKVRNVAKGVDFHETFAPMAKLTTIGVAMDLEIHQMNVLPNELTRDRHQKVVIAYELKDFCFTQSGSVEVVDKG
jgi:hypothetical protein